VARRSLWEGGYACQHRKIVCIVEGTFPEVYSYDMSDWSSCPAVERDPNKVSGSWVFRGTRVPVSALFENLEDGGQLSDFVAWFPGVTLQQARSVLEHVAHTLEAA
jgi:uncharacterized protein (DUF433 family)